MSVESQTGSAANKCRKVAVCAVQIKPEGLDKHQFAALAS